MNYGDPTTVWESVPRSAPRLRVLHLESSEGMDDASLIDILDGGNLTELEVRLRGTHPRMDPDLSYRISNFLPCPVFICWT